MLVTRLGLMPCSASKKKIAVQGNLEKKTAAANTPKVSQAAGEAQEVEKLWNENHRERSHRGSINKETTPNKASTQGKKLRAPSLYETNTVSEEVHKTAL